MNQKFNIYEKSSKMLWSEERLTCTGVNIIEMIINLPFNDDLTVRLESESPCCSISECSDSMTSKMLFPSSPPAKATTPSPPEAPVSPPPPFFAEVDVCHSNPCANGATCVENADSYKCLCLPSYGGDLCEIGTRSASANVY